MNESTLRLRGQASNTSSLPLAMARMGCDNPPNFSITLTLEPNHEAGLLPSRM